MTMTSVTDQAPSKPNLLTRSDTMLGICQGLGEDLGINPDFLRVALGVGLIWQPVIAVCTYLGIGVLVFASRMLFPTRVRVADDTEEVSVVPAAAVQSANDVEAVAQAA